MSGDDMRDARPSFKGASARPPAPAPEPKPLAAHLLIASLSLSRTRAGRHRGIRSQDAVDGGGNRTSARLYLRSLPPLPNVEREGATKITEEMRAAQAAADVSVAAHRLPPSLAAARAPKKIQD